MKNKLKVIKPYKLDNMIIVVKLDGINSYWYLYNLKGDLVREGYGTKSDTITSSQQAFKNAGQVARRYIRKDNPLIFGL